MKLSNITFLLVVLFIALNYTSQTHSLPSNEIKTDFIFQKFYVHILNGFQNETFIAHCRSKDDDLGFRQILVGSEFQWHFRINFKNTTRFLCTFTWFGGSRSFTAFWTGYSFLVDYCGNNDCIWKAQEDGIYVYHSRDHEYQFIYKWETGN